MGIEDFFKVLGGHHGGHHGSQHHGHGSQNYGNSDPCSPNASRGGFSAPSDQRPCPKCAGPVLTGSKFCPNCGGSLEPAACKGCGAKLPPAAAFCPGCGTKV